MFIQFIVNAHNVRKTTKMVNFDHILYDFSELSDQNDLIPFEYCQASSDTSLEYPRGVIWGKLKIKFFGMAGT